MSAINVPGENSPESQTQQQTPQESGSTLPPAARVRAEWKDFLQKEELDRLLIIQKERDEKKHKADQLRTAATAQKTTESWTGNKAEKPTLLGMDITDRAKATISKNVDKELASNMALFSEVGLSSPENVASIKNVAKEIIFEHFTKTGAKEAATENYVEKELVPKLKETFESLKTIYEQNKNLFTSPLQFMETFGTFCGLNIIQNGKINEPAIKTLLLIQKSGLQSLVNGFREYIPLNADVIKLNKDADTLLEAGRQRSGQPAPSETAPASTETVPTRPETIPTSTETAPAQTPETEETTQSQTENPASSKEIQTGNAVMDKILNSIKSMFPPGLFEKIMSWLNKFGLGTAEIAEFAGLTDPEKKEALILKEAANQLKLNEKVMAILYKDDAQVKKILTDKAGMINTGWNEYLQQRLDPNELELLKKDPGMETQTADKIASIILTPATPATPSPPANT